MPYAEGTTVSPERSELEIRGTLRKSGIEESIFSDMKDKFSIQFKHKTLIVQFTVPKPARDDPRFQATPIGRRRKTNGTEEAYQQEMRRLWRCMAILIKGKLEMVSSGITTFEQEFLANIRTSDGGTVGDSIIPKLPAIADGSPVKGLLT